MTLAVTGMGESFSDNAAVQELASALMKQLAQYQEPWRDDIQHYVFRDGTQEGSTATRELAIDMIRQYQKRETHPILRAEFSIIAGEEEFIPYPSERKPPGKKREMER